MNSETTIDFFKKGVHIALGATTSLVEAIQDPIKREETLGQMRMDPNELAGLLAQKGAATEVEARKFVDGVVAQYAPNPTSSPNRATSPYPTPTLDPLLLEDLRELTTQLAQLRSQLAAEGDGGKV